MPMREGKSAMTPIAGIPERNSNDVKLVAHASSLRLYG